MIDTDFNGLAPYFAHINDLDDRKVVSLSELESFDDYTPGGDIHVLGTLENLKSDLESRWDHLNLATIGARVWANEGAFDEYSPLYAGELPAPDKIRRVSVDGAFAEGRAGLFSTFAVNYIGRTNLDPKNIVLLDNKKFNPNHNPAYDETLQSLYSALPVDWWGSCAFVSTGNVDRLAEFFEMFPDIVPVAYTPGAISKLKYLGLEFAQVDTPKPTDRYGIALREAANRVGHR